MSKDYIFTSERIGFRNWTTDDIIPFARMNANESVMEHFPQTLKTSETEALISRLSSHYDTYGYTYFAVDLLETGEFMGFIGMNYKDHESPFKPATDLGWRLKPEVWGKGLATEGAQRCIDYCFKDLKITRLVSICVLSNIASENVMKKIGMTKQGTFKHPHLNDHPEYQTCMWYEIRC